MYVINGITSHFEYTVSLNFSKNLHKKGCNISSNTFLTTGIYTTNKYIKNVANDKLI